MACVCSVVCCLPQHVDTVSGKFSWGGIDSLDALPQFAARAGVDAQLAYVRHLVEPIAAATYTAHDRH